MLTEIAPPDPGIMKETRMLDKLCSQVLTGSITDEQDEKRYTHSVFQPIMVRTSDLH